MKRVLIESPFAGDRKCNSRYAYSEWYGDIANADAQMLVHRLPDETLVVVVS